MVGKEQTRISVRVQPDASQNRILSLKDGRWQVRIAAPAIKGKANQELIKFLSDILGVGRSNLTIEQGITSKQKVVGIKGLTPDQVIGQFERAMSYR
jgi:uncharacterized protein (TIGR00251 family)